MKPLDSPYPLLFKPVYKDYLWGGEKIGTVFARPDVPAPCAESWEISAHPDGMSVVENGPLAGKTLDELCREYSTALMGAHADGGRFPLLIKIIDAKTRLSIQVHPDEISAERYGGEAKTEMWYILDAPSGAFVCTGLKSGVGPRIFHDALLAKNFPTLLKTVDVVPGRAIYIPGGLVHAICEGCLILEVQQNSNTTYRVYDWDRTGSDGRPRTLHVQQAMEVIDWHAPDFGPQAPIPMTANAPANRRERILRSDFFTMERLTLTEAEPIQPNGSSFRALFAQSGGAALVWDGGEVILPAGRSCLVPATMPNYTLIPSELGAILITVEA